MGSHFSGSYLPADETRVLAITDPFGHVCTFVAYLPRALTVSDLPPSGSVVASKVYSVLYDSNQRVVIATTPSVHSSNGPKEIDDYRSIRLHEPRALTQSGFSYRDVLQEIQETFDLHTTDLAELLDVSRQAVHAWRSENGSQPGSASAQKLLSLREAATEWRRLAPNRSPGWLLNSSFQGKTLKSWLASTAHGAVQMSEVIGKMAETLSTSPSVVVQESRSLHREPTAFEDFVDSLSAHKSVRGSKKKGK